MKTSRALSAFAFGAFLAFGSSGMALAQTTPSGNTPTTTTAAAPDTSYRDNGHHFDWGWLGLIGLVGLVGLTKRDRTRIVRDPGVSRGAAVR